MINKWKINLNSDPFCSPPSCSELKDKESQKHSQRMASSSSVLADALRDNGLRDFDSSEVRECSTSLQSLMWKLISMSQENTRNLLIERERNARLENEVKLLKLKTSKLNDEICRLNREKQALVVEAGRQEEFFKSRLEAEGRTRQEWERAALEYRGREKHFVAEIKKQENQYCRFQDKVRRSLSVSNRISSGQSRVGMNAWNSPPPAGW
jgi:hypothetical protein